MTTWHGQPDLPTPALDFLRKVEVWQDALGGTAGIAVLMPDREERTLAGLLAEAGKPGPATGWLEAQAGTGALEVQARLWLIGYREMNPPLDDGQRAELDAVISRSAALPHAQPGPRLRNRAGGLPGYRAVTAALAVLALIVIALVVLLTPSGS